MQTKLMKMKYFDPKAETHLETYADLVVVEKEGSTSYIVAVRFGGYPESVKGMGDAIYGGGSVTVEIDGKLILEESLELLSYIEEVMPDKSRDDDTESTMQDIMVDVDKYLPKRKISGEENSN